MSGISGPHLRFAGALLAYVLRGGLRLPHGHKPPVGHVVPDAFAGVGIAAAEDPAVDDWLLARLRETAIRHVRLDFTYGDGERPAGRLLGRLLDAELRVTLHLVQPAEHARRMESSDEARREWQDFVAATLARFGARLEIVEIGSTTNRQRWAGHTLAGFLAMWDIAWREARARKLTLAGPSVTDFEPPWNVGLLALLRDRGQLPDLHTDNLFSERCTEPERFDHKILGHRLAPLHKFNLIKKARLLARIGADFGVPRLFSPAAFWTLPRIERQLPDSEEKQADYLARYMVLCAASGALERAWWGPLVCHREGLVDEGDFPYPALERITHYAGLRSRLADLRERPALLALRAFAMTIPGARYEGRADTSNDLEVHAFRSDSQLIHVVWTSNGRAAPLDDLYRPDDLRTARALTRDGEHFDAAPTLASEVPMFLCWPPTTEVAVRLGAETMPGVSVHRHIHGMTHFFYRQNGWKGIVVAADDKERDALLQAIQPQSIGAPVSATTLRHARNAIWTMDHPTRSGVRLVLKQPVRVPWYKRALDRNKPAKGLRSWSGASELLRLGVETARPVAYFELCGDKTKTRNFYICEYVDTQLSVRELFSAYAGGAQACAGIPAQDAYRTLCRFLLTMHGGGVFFRDLSGGNILVRLAEGGDFSYSLIDTGRIRVYRNGVPLSRRLSDLSRICNKLHWAGREILVGDYLESIGKSFGWRYRMPFYIYDAKVWMKRRIGRKAIKRWLKAVRLS